MPISEQNIRKIAMVRFYDLKVPWVSNFDCSKHETTEKVER